MPFSHSLHPADTIAALASAPGGAARGIVRVSGPATRAAVASIFIPEPQSGGVGESLGRAVAWCYPGALQIDSLSRPVPVDLYFWPDHRSYTGEPLSELHTVGSPPILEAVLAELFANGIRPAHPGEFTLRAFLTGRIDLTQAEAVLGVIDAQSEGELRTALEQLAGGLSSQILRLRGDLLDLLADLEAGLDFADEPIEFVSHAALLGRLGLAREGVAELLVRADRRLRSAPRPRVVLAGPPNAGKSTLFNALLGERAALVSEVAGTTRDYLTADLELGGVAISLVDTAGIEVQRGPIGLAAQKHRQEQMDQADLVVWCQPLDETTAVTSSTAARNGERCLVVRTKSDIGPPIVPAAHELAVSARLGLGIRDFGSAVAARLSTPVAGDRQLLGTTAARGRESLRQALAALDRALDLARHESDQDLLAIEIREALDELGKIAGAVYTDDILDRVFSRFCIGK